MGLRQGGLFFLSLIFSIAIHFLLFQEVVVVPEEYHPGFKPQVVFLGAILKNVKASLLTANNVYVSKYFVYNDIIPISDEDFRNILVDKPVYLTELENGSKAHPMKTLFPLEPVTEDNEISDIENTDMLEIQPYVPLRFYVK